jgi:hypothetical protein
MVANMVRAAPIFDYRRLLSETAFIEMVVWQVPEPIRASNHTFKYRLVLVSDGVCALRYDNEAGKGDHKHIGPVEVPYQFCGLDQLDVDFWKDVAAWLKQQDAQ